jgi:putative transport protein
MAAATEVLRGHPEVALFAALFLGFFVGKRKFGTFSLGTSAGVLLAGVLIGQLRIPIPALLESVSFALFIFVVGYRVGPQFFRGLKGEGLRLAAVAFILAVTGLLTAYAAAMLLGYDKGTAAGLLAGSLTQSAILGSAGDVIARLDRARGKAAAPRQHLGCLRRDLPVWDCRRRLVPIPSGAAPAGR